MIFLEFTKSPYILLPEKLSLDAEELYYVLCHEASHFFQHDLWLKLFSQILQAVFWWNPFSFLLKRQISLMLELRTDRYVSNDSLHREAYAQTLLQMAKLQIHQDLRPTISFCDVSGSALSQRILMLIRSPDKTRRRPVQLLFSFLIVGLYAFSLFFIFEPYSINKDDATGTLEISSETSYLIENPNGGYDLYYHSAEITDSDSKISPMSDAIEWRYKIENGKVYKRLYNYTTQQWIGDWILIS